MLIPMSHRGGPALSCLPCSRLDMRYIYRDMIHVTYLSITYGHSSKSLRNIAPLFFKDQLWPTYIGMIFALYSANARSHRLSKVKEG